MKRFLFLLALAPLFFTSLPARGEGIVLAFPDEEPNSPTTKGQTQGFLTDIMQETARRAGYPLEIRYMPLGRCIEEVRLGRVDGAFSFFRTEQRVKDLDFSDEVFNHIDQTFFVKAGVTLEVGQDVRKLRGYRLGVVNSTAHGERLDRVLRERQGHDVLIAKTYDQLAVMVATGRVAIAIAARDSMMGAINGLKLQDKIDEVKPAFESIPSFMIFTKLRDLAKVRRDLDAALRSLKSDGGYQAIWARHFS